MMSRYQHFYLYPKLLVQTTDGLVRKTGVLYENLPY
jgi:hypothetical protein